MNLFKKNLGNTQPTDVPTRLRARPWYDEPETRVGTLIRHFRLQKCLGQGGYAVSYLAVDESSPVKRQVVIKILYIRPNEDAREKIRRFVLEASALDHLANESGVVVQVERGERPAQRPEKVDDGKTKRVQRMMAHGRDYYIVLQYMSGGDLWQRVRMAPLDPYEAVRIAIAVGKALSRAHRRGLLHRDIKPDNILFDSEGNPKLADFGLARFISKGTPRVETVPSQRPTGTPGYLPPESFYGKDTVQRDVYALGVTLIEMLTGPLPNKSSEDYRDWQSAIAQALEPIQPPALQAILRRAVAEKPAERYRQVSEMTRALTDYQQNRSVASLKRTQAVAPVPKPKPVRPGSSFDLLYAAKKEVGQFISRLVNALSHLSAPQFQLPKKLKQVKVSSRSVRWAIIAFGILSTLNLVLNTWPAFYGEILSFLLPIAIGICGLLAPWLATAVAWGVLSLLLFGLSPVAGTVALVAAGSAGYKLRSFAAVRREKSLLLAWLLLMALPLANRDIALAIPIAIGAFYRTPRLGAIVGALVYLLLSIWATLQGIDTLGPTMIFDPLGLGVPWYLDATVSTFINPRVLFAFLRWSTSDGEQAWYLLTLTRELWTATLAPLLSLLIWSSAGAVAALVTQKRWPSSRISKWSAVLVAIVMIIYLNILMRFLLNLQALVQIGHLLLAGLLSAIAAYALMALLTLTQKRKK